MKRENDERDCDRRRCSPTERTFRIGIGRATGGYLEIFVPLLLPCLPCVAPLLEEDCSPTSDRPGSQGIHPRSGGILIPRDNDGGNAARRYGGGRRRPSPVRASASAAAREEKRRRRRGGSRGRSAVVFAERTAVAGRCCWFDGRGTTAPSPSSPA